MKHVVIAALVGSVSVMAIMEQFAYADNTSGGMGAGKVQMGDLSAHGGSMDSMGGGTYEALPQGTYLKFDGIDGEAKAVNPGDIVYEQVPQGTYLKLDPIYGEANAVNQGDIIYEPIPQATSSEGLGLGAIIAVGAVNDSAGGGGAYEVIPQATASGGNVLYDDPTGGTYPAPISATSGGTYPEPSFEFVQPNASGGGGLIAAGQGVAVPTVASSSGMQVPRPEPTPTPLPAYGGGSGVLVAPTAAIGSFGASSVPVQDSSGGSVYIRGDYSDGGGNSGGAAGVD